MKFVDRLNCAIWFNILFVTLASCALLFTYLSENTVGLGELGGMLAGMLSMLMHLLLYSISMPWSLRLPCNTFTDHIHHCGVYMTLAPALAGIFVNVTILGYLVDFFRSRFNKNDTTMSRSTPMLVITMNVFIVVTAIGIVAYPYVSL